MSPIIYKKAEGFEWDLWNIKKNRENHNVEPHEAEESFKDPNKVVFRDVIHTQSENRYILIGKTKRGRILYNVFVLRNRLIRVISSRDINRKEKHLYEKKS